MEQGRLPAMALLRLPRRPDRLSLTQQVTCREARTSHLSPHGSCYRRDASPQEPALAESETIAAFRRVAEHLRTGTGASRTIIRVDCAPLGLELETVAVDRVTRVPEPWRVSGHRRFVKAPRCAGSRSIAVPSSWRIASTPGTRKSRRKTMWSSSTASAPRWSPESSGAPTWWASSPFTTRGGRARGVTGKWP